MSTKQQINANIKNSNGPDKIKWVDIKWMSGRRSMRDWTIEQLLTQWHATNVEHNITSQYIETGM